MKKLLVTLSVSVLALVYTQAQSTIYFQNFAATMTNMPAGWDTGYFKYHPGNPGFKFDNVFAGARWNKYTAAHGYVAFVDDADYNLNIVNDYDTIYTCIVNCSAYTHVFVSFDLNFNNYTGAEVGTLIASNDGGKTWKLVANLPSIQGNTNWQDSLIADLTPIAGGKANVMLAFTWNNVGAVSMGYFGWGMAIANLDVYAPLNYDVAVISQNLPALMQVNQSYTFSGTDYNYEGDSIVSMNMNYSANGNPVQTQTISGISGFNSLTSYNWTMGSKPFTPTSAGTYKVKFWADQLNGIAKSQSPSHDTLVANFWAVDTVKTREALFEEFTGQSCVFCMTADPNVDTVSTANASKSNIVRYHVPIPGRDFMYEENTSQITTREGYYSVGSAPTGFMDGATLYPGADYGPPNQRYSSTTIQTDNAIGSPIKIDITNAKYNTKLDSFGISFNITSYAALPAGLIAQVDLLVDSIYYYIDLSQDDPQNTFAPPVGTGYNIGFGYPDAPDFYFPYVLKFSTVVEEFLPSASGTTLNQFTSGQSQNISLGWKKNHSWGQYPRGGGPSLLDSTKYDSSRTYHFVVFVQTNSAMGPQGIPAKYVFQSASAPVDVVAGLEEIADGIYYKMYPNPTNNITNLSFNIDKTQNISVEIYNMLGENVYTTNEGSMSAGQHILSIDCSSFPSGIYLVKFNADKVVSTNKLIIQK